MVFALLNKEHTRLKPLSVAIMVREESRRVLGFSVSQFPASGLIAQRSQEKYGFRQNRSGYAHRTRLKTLGPYIAPHATVTCDEHPCYYEELKASLVAVNVVLCGLSYRTGRIETNPLGSAVCHQPYLGDDER